MSFLTDLLPESATSLVPEEFAAFLPIVLLAVVAYYAIAVFIAIAMEWRIFKKAGYWGILSLIPIVNAFLFTKIIFGRAWILFLYLIPGVNLILALIAPFRFARMFGRGFFFGIGMLLFPWIFMPVVAFGDLEYAGN